jgi:hypothetical protein
MRYVSARRNLRGQDTWGHEPADPPVEQPRSSTAINPATAKALALTIPPSPRQRAEVIQRCCWPVTAQITPFLSFIAAAVLCFVIAIADGEALTAGEVRGTAQTSSSTCPSARIRRWLQVSYAPHAASPGGSFGRRDGRLPSWIGLPP